MFHRTQHQNDINNGCAIAQYSINIVMAFGFMFAIEFWRNNLSFPFTKPSGHSTSRRQQQATKTMTITAVRCVFAMFMRNQHIPLRISYVGIRVEDAFASFRF